MIGAPLAGLRPQPEVESADDAPPPDPEALGPAEADLPDLAPDWSAFDLGSALRALKSPSPQIQVRALRRLHIRWYHCSANA